MILVGRPVGIGALQRGNSCEGLVREKLLRIILPSLRNVY
jgi:hypothetical protein